jgi:hypothetical protein
METCFGRGLNTAQQLAVKGALRQLKVNENFQECKLWGLILGQENDYIIALATNIGAVIQKSYYFSIDQGLTFSQLPAVDSFIQEQAAQIRGLFTGNPSRKCYPRQAHDHYAHSKSEEKKEKSFEANPEDVLAQTAPEKKGASPRVLSELERLAYTVTNIDKDCCLTPTGYYYFSAQGQIRRDPNFGGIPLNATVTTKHFLQFREPIVQQTLAIRRRNVNNNTFDFLDPVADSANWRLSSEPQVGELGLHVQLRSLLWYCTQLAHMFMKNDIARFHNALHTTPAL